jgi:glycosyltransferase involved in cell wall biosynthesis
VRIAIDARAAAEVPAGRGRYVRELLRALAARDDDHEYTLYARTRWEQLEGGGRFSWWLSAAPGLSWPLAAGMAMSRAGDVALACTSYAITAPWRIPGAAIVWDFAAFDPALRAPRGSALERLTLPVALRRAGSLIAISQATREELERRYPRAFGRTTVATPAADASFTTVPAPGDEDVLARHGVRRPYVLVTGTVEPRKNLPRLIEAFAGLPEHERAGWTLVLAGASGWQTEDSFASVARHAGLVQSLGYVPDEELPALYRGADLFAYVSLYEGFGIPVLEAMQCGTAVLTSSVSSMPEVGGEAARYADPLEVASIRRGLAELMGDADLRGRCARAGVERAGLFSWEQTAASVLAVLEELGAGRGRAPSGA